VFGKAGELMIGPSWVLFTVMGVHYFHVHIRGIDPQRGLWQHGSAAGAPASARYLGRFSRHAGRAIGSSVQLGVCSDISPLGRDAEGLGVY
jgi:hypothetical protein